MTKLADAPLRPGYDRPLREGEVHAFTGSAYKVYVQKKLPPADLRGEGGDLDPEFARPTEKAFAGLAEFTSDLKRRCLGLPVDGDG